MMTAMESMANEERKERAKKVKTAIAQLRGAFDCLVNGEDAEARTLLDRTIELAQEAGEENERSESRCESGLFCEWCGDRVGCVSRGEDLDED